MKLFLLYHGRFPGEKAAALFTAKNAEAFGKLGFEVTVIVPRRFGRAKVGPAEYFGVAENFRTVFLPTLDLFAVPLFERFAFKLSYAVFSVSSLIYLLFRARSADIIYSNEALPCLLASFFFPKTIYEIHDFPKLNFINKKLLSRIRFGLATNKWKKNKIEEYFGLPGHKLIYEPNAVDFDRFNSAAPAERSAFGISDGIKLCGYVGSLRTMGVEKGITDLLKAVQLLNENFGCLIIGGSREDIDFYKNKAAALGVADRLFFTGFVRHEKVPGLLKMCDCLVAPFPKTDHYNFYMSPMKVFEYMATGKIIVASDLESIREFAPVGGVLFYEPENLAKLAESIRNACVDKRPDVSKNLDFAREHDWQNRAERIAKSIAEI